MRCASSIARLNVKPDDGNLIATKTLTYQKIGRLDEAAPLIEALRPDGSLPQVVYRDRGAGES